MKAITVFGTRPEIIKLSSLFSLLDNACTHKMVHTGQHYSYEMDKIFFEELKIRNPDYMLNVGSGTQGYQLGNMIIKLEEIFLTEKPDIVIVQGDTNSTLAGALAASKNNIKLVHIEAGCRSFNKSMPEEINRILTDHASDILIAADHESYSNLVIERISKDKIFEVGSTVFDAICRNIELAPKKKILDKYKLQKERFVLATIHRAENTNDAIVLKSIFAGFSEISKKIQIVIPLHPRTKKIIEENKIKISSNIKIIEPLGYLEFLALLSNAYFVMTDSGGVQEEAIFTNTPCLIIRNETEWVEYVKSGKNKLVGTKTEEIIKAGSILIDKPKIRDKIKAIKPKNKTHVSEVIISIITKLK